MTLVIAHRGSGPFGPERENTVAAFEAAARLGADGVELDVRRTADRRLVVHHDATLESGAAICELTSAELPSYLPSLAEALDACAGLLVNVEVKNWPEDVDYDPSQWVARETGRLLAERKEPPPGGRDSSVVVSSFSLEAVKAVQEVAPEFETAWIVGAEAAGKDLVAVVSRAGIEGLHPFDWLVDAPLVEAAHAAGLALRVWTVNNGDRVAELDALGVEGVITNDVKLARQALAEAGLAKKPAGREQSGS